MWVSKGGVKTLLLQSEKERMSKFELDKLWNNKIKVSNQVSTQVSPAYHTISFTTTTAPTNISTAVPTRLYEHTSGQLSLLSLLLAWRAKPGEGSGRCRDQVSQVQWGGWRDGDRVNSTEEEVTSPQRPPSLHQGRDWEVRPTSEWR